MSFYSTQITSKILILCSIYTFFSDIMIKLKKTGTKPPPNKTIMYLRISIGGDCAQACHIGSAVALSHQDAVQIHSLMQAVRDLWCAA
jgi:hypothetical protein